LNSRINQLTNQINDLTTERNNHPNITNQEYDNLFQERDNIRNQFTTADNLINNTQTLLGIDDLNNLPQIPEGETLNTLLARPTPAVLQAERNKVVDLEGRNNILQQETNNMQTQRDSRPNITLAQ